MKKLPKSSTPGILTIIVTVLILILSSCRQDSGFYSVNDFEKIRKIDAHFHYNVMDTRFLEYADSLNFKFVSPNTGNILDDQFLVASTLKREHPDKLAFLGTFAAENFYQPDFAEATIERIDMVMDAGASGIKIWKDIGMVIRDSAGNYIMADDPVFKPVFDYLEEKGIPVMGHLGEPKNCWLPLDEMTVKSNRDYYTKNPQYHMYLIPEAPSYEEHMAARDHVLEQHPNLPFIGAHLASLEWSVDELALRLDRFPKLTVDMASRVYHLQYQSITNYQGVRDFLIKYQDRILYATDRGVRPGDTDYESLKQGTLKKWMAEWIFLATDSSFTSEQVDQKVIRGLQLPKEVIDKIYYSNAEYLFQNRE